MSVDRRSDSRISDSDGSADDFDSSSESEGLFHQAPVSSGPFALNEALVTNLQEHDENPIAEGTSPEWDEDGGSDSDSWASYLRDTTWKTPTDVVLVSDVRNVAVKTCSAFPSTEGTNQRTLITGKSQFPKFLDNESTSNEIVKYKATNQSDDLEQNTAINIDRIENLQTTSVSKSKKPYETDETEESKYLTDGLRETHDNQNANNLMENKSDPIVWQEPLQKCKGNGLKIISDRSDLHIDVGIRPITVVKPTIPKKPHIIPQVHTERETITTDSPHLNRKFNSVSPKRKKNCRPTTVIENKSLALSLDCQLDKQTSSVCQQKEDVDEGISSDSESKKSLPTNCRGTIRRSTYIKRIGRPKSEAFLDSIHHGPEEIYKSSVSVTSVSERVKSEWNEEAEDLDRRQPNFAFIRVSRITYILRYYFASFLYVTSLASSHSISTLCVNCIR